MENYDGINQKVIQFTPIERETINRIFEKELREEYLKILDEFDAEQQVEIILDEMYRFRTEIHRGEHGVKIEENFEYYEDDDGDLWYHEIPKTLHPSGNQKIVSVKPEDKTYLQLFLGDENYQAFMEQTK